MKAADPYDDIIFAHTFDPKLKTGKSKIVLYKNFDDSFVNIIERIKEEECIYNQFSFEKKYIFLHPFKFLKKEMQDINIFSSYISICKRFS